MPCTDPTDSAASARARAWRHAGQAATCDVVAPWSHGTVLRATAHPGYHAFNAVRVESDPRMSVDALGALADRALDGLGHRRIEFDSVALAEPLRTEFEARGWTSSRLVWMRHQYPSPPGPDDAVVEEVAYDEVRPLRLAWNQEDSPDQDPTNLADARAVALARGMVILAARRRGRPVAYVQLERRGAAAEIVEVYVHRDRRGRGLGAATVRAAVEAAGPVEDLWLCADAEGRPRRLYHRLGFRSAATTMEFLRIL